MPIKSQAQRGAMYSAAEGKSTLGIPPSVGKEFVATDKPGKLPPRAEGLSAKLARQKEERGEPRRSPAAERREERKERK